MNNLFPINYLLISDQVNRNRLQGQKGNHLALIIFIPNIRTQDNNFVNVEIIFANHKITN